MAIGTLCVRPLTGEKGEEQPHLGHAVVVGRQGLGNGCRLKDIVHNRSVHDPVKDVTSDMFRLDNTLRKARTSRMSMILAVLGSSGSRSGS